jgi:thiol peroxidase
MRIRILVIISLFALMLALTGCSVIRHVTSPLLRLVGISTEDKEEIRIDPGSVLPGTKVTRKGKDIHLLGNPIAVGQKLPSTFLVDAMTMQDVELSTEHGKVLFLSLVPSIDTKVCEAQTHYLGEEGYRIAPYIRRITISRDTPFAQKRFAEAAKLTDIQYLSDYKEGAFGRSLGLLMDGPRLLARSVIVMDKQGVVRYIQVVPEITNLPDMEKAFDRALEIAQE